MTETIIIPKRSIDVVFRWNGVDYALTDRFDHSAVSDDVEWQDGVGYQWTDGNFGCDCNRSEFILRENPDLELDPLECGETIELRKLTVTHWDGRIVTLVDADVVV